MTLYATGARRNELARLKVSDIDSRRMVIHIQGGKGRKDRDVMLSPVLLEALREYWRRLKPKTWLFPGSRAHTAPCPITSKVIWHACHQAALRAGLHKRDRLLITEEGAVLELRTVHAQPATAPRKSVSAK